jgi:RND superfamily putative drug exporter
VTRRHDQSPATKSGTLKQVASLTSRYAVLVVLGWVVAAGLGNIAVPQLERVVALHSRSFMPASAPSSTASMRSAELLGEPPSDNLNYVVLERNQPLQQQDRQYYDALVAKLGTDSKYVYSVSDLWSDPLTSSMAQSPDGRAVSLMLRMSGMLGTSAASDSVNAVRRTVAQLPAPAGLKVFVTGPGSTIVDEFAAIDHQTLLITAATVLVILILLLIVYRSLVTAAVPLISVGLALGVARPVVALLGDHQLVEVSLFTVALIAAMILGAGTDYAIFLIGRYHEGRRRAIDPALALATAYRSVAPVIVGSALTMAAALSCLSFANVGIFRSAGLPCAVGVLIGMLCALTLTPALISLGGRLGLLEPRRSVIARRWRRIGVRVVRWPGAVFAVSGTLIIVLILPAFTTRTGWNEPAAVPAGAESSQGYAANDRHSPGNLLFPDVVIVEADHDLRNPSGLIAIERISRQIMAIPGVRMVQSASRPAGRVPDEASLTYQAGLAGSQLADGVSGLTTRLKKLGDVDAELSRLTETVDQLSREMRSSAAGLDQIAAGRNDVQSGMDGLQSTLTGLSDELDPLRKFVDNTTDCKSNPICSPVTRLVESVDSAARSSSALSNGAGNLTSGAATVTAPLATAPQLLQSMRTVLGRAEMATRDLLGLTDSMAPQLRQLTDYLQEIDADFRGSAAGGFYLPSQALKDPRYQEVLRYLMSRDGRAAFLMIYGNGQVWGNDGAQRAAQIELAVREAAKEGTLTPTAVDLTGVGPATHDLQILVRRDTILLMGATLALIFLIVALMVRSPAAAVIVVGTVSVSFAATVGVSVVVCQHLLGHQLHWAVTPIAFIALVAVGADYNLLLALRIREEAGAGLRTGVVRAFAGTGGVVTTAGIVFGITMLALASSTVVSVAQLGITIGIGLLMDTLLVRTFLMPPLVVLLGRWFWWPSWATLSMGRGRPPE